MISDSSPSSTIPPATVRSAAIGSATDAFEERWAAWQARGAAHDRAVRRKLAIAGPVVAAIAAVVLYALVIR